MSDVSTQQQTTVENFKDFYRRLLPYLNSPNPATGFTPVGTIISIMSNTAPEFYLACDGSVYNIVDYPELVNHFEAQFGSKNYFGGDGTTTFAVPDLQGEFLRGTGTNSHENQGSGGEVGEHQDGTESPWIGAWGTYNMLELSTTSGSTSNANVYKEDARVGERATRIYLDTNGRFSSDSAATSKERYTSRPTNTSVLYCIAYKNIQISLTDGRPIQAALDRWLRFDPENKKGLIIKAGTSILKQDGTYKTFLVDSKIDFSSAITGSDNGKDFFVYLNNDDSVTATVTKNGTGTYIGRFHTLCADAGSNLTMIAPDSPSSGKTVGQSFLVKPYNADDDPDFYLFYNKTITAVSAGTPYDVITCEHPLKGYSAGDILPESVFCKTFYPECLYEDAMVYDKATNICVDIYLQSGTGLSTKSVYNVTHTVSRQPVNHMRDMVQVGKQLLSDHEFMSIALGSNECTNIVGSSDKTTVGGHSDTAGRRMISAIGVEEACGYLWQWSREFTGGTTDSWGVRDGRGSFGQEYRDLIVLLFGGDWEYGSKSGSGCRASVDVRSTVHAYSGGRGCTKIVRSANAPKNSLVTKQVNYSTDEQIVGTWIDGKPLYQRTYEVNNLTKNGDTYFDTSFTVANYTLISASGYLISNENYSYILGYSDTMRYFGVCQRTTGTVGLTIFIHENNSSVSYPKAYITVQYTKTTD